MVGDGKYRDTDLSGFVNDLLDVYTAIPAKGLSAKRGAVVVGIYLKRAPVKDGTRRKRLGLGDRIFGTQLRPP